MLDYFLLGLLQGILEWIPVSSEGFISIILQSLETEANPVSLAIYFHLGTAFSVLVYLREEVKEIVSNIFSKDFSGLTGFILISTICSIIVGFPLYFFAKSFSGLGLLLLFGVGLMVTGIMLKGRKGFKQKEEMDYKDAVYAGALQGLAVVPGLSRSGVTLFALFSSGYAPDTALKTSFLMSVPVVLGAAVFMHLDSFVFKPVYLLSLVAAFSTGIIAMHFLLSLSSRLDFSKVCWFFGAIAILAALGGFYV